MSDAARRRFRYSVDRNDSIASVDSAWLEFARANGAPELTRESVLGRPLWDFLAGGETRQIYRMVLERVRATGRPVVLPFRCDSPDRCRHMQLVISPLGEGAVQLEGMLEREEPRPRVALFDIEDERSKKFLSICSWCKRVRATAGEWIEVEDAIVRMNLFHKRKLPQLTHGICNACDVGIEAALGELEAE